MASIVTNRGKRLFADGGCDWDTTTVKAMLLSSAYTPNADHSTVNSISSNEISVTGYTGGYGGAGRLSLASKTVTQDDTNDRVDLDAADLSHGALGAGATIRYLALIIETGGNDSSSHVLAILDYGADYPTNGGAFTSQFAAAGLLRAA